MRKIISSVVLVVLGGWHAASQAETLINPSLLANTENGVFMSNGRYFVAGGDGIHEIKATPDYSSNCKRDTLSGYTSCRLVSNQFQGETCFFSGMTTDNTYLYAACTIWQDGLLGQLQPPKRATLFRIKPGSGSTVAAQLTRDFAQPAWYNGMTMLNGNTLLMTPSALFGGQTAITKLTITNTSTLQFQVSEWLNSNGLYLLPNGLRYDKGFVYFVGGQNLWRIRVNSNGTAGWPVLLFQTTINQVLDDFAIDGDWIVVSNHAIVNGLGLNTLTRVHKTGLLLPQFISTGMTQISSVAVDPGSFMDPGSYISTSFFQGGIYRFD